MLGKAMEELFTWLRGLYLVMLFLPALLTAPLCVSLGYQRPSWVKVRCVWGPEMRSGLDLGIESVLLALLGSAPGPGIKVLRAGW